MMWQTTAINNATSRPKLSLLIFSKLNSPPMGAAAVGGSSPVALLSVDLHSRLHVRGFRSLSLSFLGFVTGSSKPQNHYQHLAIRNSVERIKAKSSSELRRKHAGVIGGLEDEKLRSLRELFSSPDVGIDAYIIPSQDAHQRELRYEGEARGSHSQKR